MDFQKQTNNTCLLEVHLKMKKHLLEMVKPQGPSQMSLFVLFPPRSVLILLGVENQRICESSAEKKWRFFG